MPVIVHQGAIKTMRKARLEPNSRERRRPS
jgi:hypothetical protein